MDKKWLLQNDHKKKVVFFNMLDIFGYIYLYLLIYGQKTISDIYGFKGKKRVLLKLFQNNVIFLESKRRFFLNDLFRTIFKSDLRKTSFFSKCWYFWTYGGKTTFSKWSQNKEINLEMLIFADLWTKTNLKLFQNNVIFLESLIFLEMWAKNDFLKWFI